MATFQKPENALRRAEELIDVGKKQDALDTLHAAIQHKKFRNAWSPTLEEIIIRHLLLCVELKKMRTAREALHQYRSTCQAANIGSLELVVQRFRKAAEEKVNEAKKIKDLKMSQLDDLDGEMAAPQSVLLRAIQASDTRQQSQDRDVHEHFRFLWDTYKVILDVLKSSARLEEVYHETARLAFDFCRTNKRPTEFKRLCETVRKNFQDTSKKTDRSRSQHEVNPNALDTINRTLDTRCRQLQIATELDMWREAHHTAKEMMELMNKTRPKPHLRSMYYEYLGQIFWKSEEFLFHAFACLKNLLFVKAAKQNIQKSELQLLASKAVLAALCVPFQKSSDIAASLDPPDGNEKVRQNAALFNSQSIPTRESIIQQLQEKGLVTLAAEPCQRLFALIESDFTPLSLCQDAKPFLDNLHEENLCEAKLKDYELPLKQIIFFRLTKQLSEVYASMTIENFEKAASIVPFNVAEKWMANAARQQGINIQINYIQKAIVFGSARKVDMRSMRQPLIEIGHKLQQAMNRVAPEEQQKREIREKREIVVDIQKRVEEETRQIRTRKEEIERRKEASERRKEIAQREEMERERKKEAREAEVERVRQAEERKKREQEREEAKRRDAEMAKNKEMLDQMKKQAEQRAVTLKIGSKKINEIDEQDLAKMDFSQIEKARDQQLQRERLEKIRLRKLESKRIDHLARAMREESCALIDDWADSIRDEDRNFLDRCESRNAEGQRKDHEAGLQEKRLLEVFAPAKDDWVQEQLDMREEIHEEAVTSRRLRCVKKMAEVKLERARQRREDWEKEERAKREKERKEREEEERRIREEEEEEERQRLQEERRRRDEERRRQREEEEEERRIEKEREEEEERRRMEERKEKRRIEREEQAAAAERAAEKQRQKEREIEERQKERDREDREAREAAKGGGDRDRDRGGWRDRDRDRRGGRDDGDDNWRGGDRGGDRGFDRDRDRGGERGGFDRDRDRGGFDRDRDRGGFDRGTDRGGDRGFDRDRDRGGDRGGDRSIGGGGWRDRPGGAGRGEDRDDWRRAPGPRNTAEEDDGPRRGGGRDDGPRRPAPTAPRADERDDWRRGGDDRRDQFDDRRGGKGGGKGDDDDRRGGKGGRDDDDRRGGKGGRDGNAWGRGPAEKDAPLTSERRPTPPWKRRAAEAGAGGGGGANAGAGGGDETPSRRIEEPRRREEPRAPAPAPEPSALAGASAEPDDDDDGFTKVAGGKKKKGAKAPPWRGS